MQLCLKMTKRLQFSPLGTFIEEILTAIVKHYRWLFVKIYIFYPIKKALIIFVL